MERSGSQKRKPISRIKEHTQNLQFILNDASFFIGFLAARRVEARGKDWHTVLRPVILAVPLTVTLGLKCSNRTINQKEQRTTEILRPRGEEKQAEKCLWHASLIIDQRYLACWVQLYIFQNRHICSWFFFSCLFLRNTGSIGPHFLTEFRS